ncbi:MAG TPA: SHOCT domain-containing protein [Desulfobaccales bacterium]|nr:SHOCT domain-containing protein [Desulfobaccales bacterium]
MYPEQYWSWHVWMFPMVMPIIWILVIALILYLIFGRGSSRRSWQPGPPASPPETALDILKKRYARGEISKAEFEQMKRDIMS